MGYPMTFGRVLSRNGLADGDYETTPAMWHASGSATAWGLLDTADPKEVLEHAKRIEGWAAEQAEAAMNRARMLAGDLRRLERDTVDEAAICRRISPVTGMDRDGVAAVLREWMAL